MIESLHNHTTLSDGKITPQELFELAESLDLSAIAFTDHDTLPDSKTMEYLNSVRKSDTKWIVGIEMTVRPPKESGNVVGTIHIIGLFVDPQNPELVAHCKKAHVARIERMQSMLQNLRKLGFIITEEDCLKESEGESVGRPHIVSALLKYPQNQEVINRLMFEMKEAARSDASIALQYQTMLQYGKEKYPYTLFLSPDAFKHAYVEVKYLPTFDEAVSLIRKAGGVAIFAHYSYDNKKVPMYVIRELLKDNRMDGVEVVYGLNAIGTIDEARFAEDKVLLRSLAGVNKKLIAGGADAHEGNKLRKYASYRELSEDSIGLAQKIIDSKLVDVKNSSFYKPE